MTIPLLPTKSKYGGMEQRGKLLKMCVHDSAAKRDPPTSFKRLILKACILFPGGYDIHCQTLRLAHFPSSSEAAAAGD